MSNFDGKVAIVTGAGNGIGRAAALAFARKGTGVMVVDIDEDAGRETVSLVREEGGDADFSRCDVSSSTDVQQMVAATISRFSRLDYALNNAGVSSMSVDITQMPEEEWDRVTGVMLRGVFLCMKYEIPHMLPHGGAVVNTASGAGLTGFAGKSPYVASKHGVIGLTRSAALDFGARGVRVNAICPGTIETSRVAANAERSGKRQMLLDMHPIGRFGTPEEIADAAVWLCSDEASFVLGHALSVDGGYVVP